MAHIFIVVPTFREPAKISDWLASFGSINLSGVTALLVNGNPGDTTSNLIRDAASHLPIHELKGDPTLFWAGLTNLGLRQALREGGDGDYVVLMNADIEFTRDMFSALMEKGRTTHNAQLAAVTISGQRVVSSGVKVISWFLTLNRHPLAGTLDTDLPSDTLIPVDYLPTRCTLIPLAAVRQAGLIAESALPHYGADYEYTNRLRKLGYQPFIFSGARVRLDGENTGNNVFWRRLSLGTRLRSLFSIKSTSNPIYRIRFILLAYPMYAWPSAMLLYTLRSVLEVLLGGAVIKSLLPRSESGFSGS